MKLILLCLLFSTSVYSKEASKTVYINNLLELLEVDEWVSYVKRVKSDEVIPAYFVFKEPSEQRRKELINYDISNYEKGLVKQFNDLLKSSEIQQSIRVFENPFVIKTLRSINLLNWNYTSIINTSPIDYKGSREGLLKSVFNITSLQIITDYEYAKYEAQLERYNNNREILQIQNSTKVDKNNMKLINKEQFKSLALVRLNESLLNYKNVEIAEFIRLLKNNKSAQKSIQVFKTYNYLFMKKFQLSAR